MNLKLKLVEIGLEELGIKGDIEEKSLGAEMKKMGA